MIIIVIIIIIIIIVHKEKFLQYYWPRKMQFWGNKQKILIGGRKSQISNQMRALDCAIFA